MKFVLQITLALILRRVPLYALHGLHLGTIEDNAFKHKKWQFEARIVDLYRKVLQMRMKSGRHSQMRTVSRDYSGRNKKNIIA
jgi:hypothetical protein